MKITTRLREMANSPYYATAKKTLLDAADEIEHLESCNVEVRERVSKLEAPALVIIEQAGKMQLKGAHYTDIEVRINGGDKRYEGDWIKACADQFADALGTSIPRT